jgi:hypothetical protein
MPMPRGMVRGYSGYYNGIYLRSSLEFAYAYYLDYHNIVWEYEKTTYSLQDFSYKPDFFIMDNNEVIKIVEVKGEGNSKLGQEKLEAFQKEYNIPIEIYNYKNLVKLYQEEMPLRLNTAKKMWINEYDTKLATCYQKGKNNPMFDVKQRESTKILISERAKERFENEDYKEYLTSKLIAFNRANNFAYMKELRSKRMIVDCANLKCPNRFEVTVHSPRKYCSIECACNVSSKLGAESLRLSAKDLRNKVKDYILDWAIENKDIVLETVFNGITNLNPLYIQIENLFGIKDKRIISKAIFGEDKGRKEFLKYLKELVS